MNPEVKEASIRIQRRVVEHYNQVLRQDMSDHERNAIQVKLAQAESVLSALLTDLIAA